MKYLPKFVNNVHQTTILGFWGSTVRELFAKDCEHGSPNLVSHEVWWTLFSNGDYVIDHQVVHELCGDHSTLKNGKGSHYTQRRLKSKWDFKPLPYGTVRYLVWYGTVREGPAACTNFMAECYLLSNDSHVNMNYLKLSFNTYYFNRVAV